jgi:hypothetical protein
MLSTKEITAELGRQVASQLPGFSWKNSSGRLHRVTNAGWQAIVIEALTSGTRGFFTVQTFAHVRVDAIEATYLPLHPFVDASAAKLHPTLTANCAHLVRDRSLLGPFQSEALVLKEFIPRYSVELRDSVIPWLEKYSSEDALFAGLIDADPAKWITSDRLSRYPVLMAISARRRDWARFDILKAEFDAYCEERHARVHKPLAEAMAKMRSEAL